jgi:hypothetical protein
VKELSGKKLQEQKRVLFAPLLLFSKVTLELEESSAAYACNPSYLGGEIRRINVQGQPGQKVCKTPFQGTKS